MCSVGCRCQKVHEVRCLPDGSEVLVPLRPYRRPLTPEQEDLRRKVDYLLRNARRKPA